MTNKGSIKHDFEIAGKKTKLLGHNKTATLDGHALEGQAVHVQVHRPGPRRRPGMKGTFKAT